jgi:hypothetical protein
LSVGDNIVVPYEAYVKKEKGGKIEIFKFIMYIKEIISGKNRK